MESVSKTRVTPAQAGAIVRDALGGDRTLVELVEFTDGWFNAVYLAVVDDGRRLVLKVAPPPGVAVLGYERDLLHAEIDALRLVRAHTSVAVPEVVWVDEAQRLPSPSMLTTFVEGRTLHHVTGELDTSAVDVIDRQIGTRLRDIHGITAPAFGLLATSMPRHDRWSAACGELFEMLLRDGGARDVSLPIDADAVRAVVAASRVQLDEVTVPRLVLWDLWAGNVMVDPTAPAVTGFFDLERALWGDPLMEVQFAPPGPTPAFAAGYASTGDVADPLGTPAAHHRRALYTLYLHLVMGIEGAYRHYPTDPLGEWARSQLVDDLERCRAGLDD